MPPLLVFDVIAPVPAILDGFKSASIIGRAVADGLIALNVIELRDFAADKHRLIDDHPFGGGAGMVLKPGPLFAAIESRLALAPADRTRVLLFTPQGRRFHQAEAEGFAAWANAVRASATSTPAVIASAPTTIASNPTTIVLSADAEPAPAAEPAPPRLILVCGRYEGIDERVIEHFRPELISIGDFVITGGEVAAMVVIEAVARLLPGVCGNAQSLDEESFGGDDGGFEYPQFTRPASFRGYDVPEVLLNGNHAAITAWRKAEGERRTREAREKRATPDPK